MNRALFFSTLKSKFKFILICSSALVLYSVIIISMYDPNNSESSKIFMEMMPEDFIKALGFTVLDTGLTAFLGTTMYSMPYMIFMIAFTLITANSLVARNVDRGSMACYLSTPVSKSKVVMTQGSILVVGQFIMATILTILSILAADSIFGSGLLEYDSFINVNLLGFLLFFVVGAYSFLFSCIFNEEKYSIAFSSGVTLVFYVLNAIGNMSENLSFFNKISIFGAFNPAKIVNGSVSIIIPSIIFIVSGIVLYFIAIQVFNRKNLPL
ncbi:MAG: transporter permease [Herbinix sp.]|jgi:ABC-2 type transport system permease protein|nr:transporter permease [Herbinix sp.]